MKVAKGAKGELGTVGMWSALLDNFQGNGQDFNL